MISIVHNNSDKGEGGRSEILKIYNVQRLTLFCANIVKKDPGRAGQNNLATAGTNFTKPGAQKKGDLCTRRVEWLDCKKGEGIIHQSSQIRK